MVGHNAVRCCEETRISRTRKQRNTCACSESAAGRRRQSDSFSTHWHNIIYIIINCNYQREIAVNAYHIDDERNGICCYGASYGKHVCVCVCVCENQDKKWKLQRKQLITMPMMNNKLSRWQWQEWHLYMWQWWRWMTCNDWYPHWVFTREIQHVTDTLP